MKNIFLTILSVVAVVTIGNAQIPNDTLYVYGPGGPLGPINECAKVFGKQHDIVIKVTAGPDNEWMPDAMKHADLFFGGAEYMLSKFMSDHPNMIVANSRTELYKRAAAILVRPGNPKNIKNLGDLCKPGVKILDVNGAGQMGLWEDLAGRQDLIANIQQRIAGTFANSALGIAAWKNDPQYDAWITFGSWHNRLPDLTSMVRIPITQTVYRGTPVVRGSTGTHKSETEDFIKFMQSDKGHLIFKKWGWE
ncbi:substrate-binding domain-containing protein [Pedobacter sp. Leaf132]|uniref:substrate-binding domain-containing protein n=1 Tax=Pedobacter sp. Leaf132 TaxID=2876557 RepID=UPI001E53DB76|nr:substrate-binding domain-containing protein [Pedobacter sp. Leaf132]